MKTVTLEEGMWILFLHEGRKLRGKIARKESAEPLSETNFWVNVYGAFYQISLEQILRVYPRFEFRFNPSVR